MYGFGEQRHTYNISIPQHFENLIYGYHSYVLGDLTHQIWCFVLYTWVEYYCQSWGADILVTLMLVHVLSKKMC